MPYADPEAQRAYQREWIARRRVDWLAEHGPCVDCGSWDDLEVDHVNPAEKVTHRIWSWSRARRETELLKCVARCVRCHDKKTLVGREYRHGTQHPATHLSEEDVRAIKESLDSERVLARRYGIAPSAVHRIRAGQTWKHLT